MRLVPRHAPLLAAALVTRPGCPRLPAARASADDEGGALAGPPPPDPIYADSLWLKTETVRYGTGDADGGGVGHFAAYVPWIVSGNHSRAVLLLDTEPEAHADGELAGLADRLALSCECVALLPSLRGGAARWPQARLADEVWAAISYLNRAHHAEAVGIIGVGRAAGATLELMAEGRLDAHALVALCPTSRAKGSLERSASEVRAPTLAVCGGGGAEADELRDGLARNGRLGSSYYVASFDDASSDFVLAPTGDGDGRDADRAVALLQSWLDRHVPERLGGA